MFVERCSRNLEYPRHLTLVWYHISLQCHLGCCRAIIAFEYNIHVVEHVGLVYMIRKFNATTEISPLLQSSLHPLQDYDWSAVSRFNCAATARTVYSPSAWILIFSSRHCLGMNKEICGAALYSLFGIDLYGHPTATVPFLL